MKTPREVLLERHRSINARLDALRRRVIAEHLEERPARRPGPLPQFFALLWRELVWPSRRSWAGLAVLWVAILTLHWTTLPEDTARSVNSGSRNPSVEEIRQAMGEQARLRAELFDQDLPSLADPPARETPGPRSRTVPASDAEFPATTV